MEKLELFGQPNINSRTIHSDSVYIPVGCICICLYIKKAMSFLKKKLKEDYYLSH